VTTQTHAERRYDVLVIDAGQPRTAGDFGVRLADGTAVLVARPVTRSAVAGRTGSGARVRARGGQGAEQGE
jgi:hypothetical protein